MERVPVAAGTFYPASSSKLKTILADLFEGTKRQSSDDVVALILPHAGYVFSGKVAAAGIAQINPQKSYEHIFIVGSSHTHLFKGASIYTQGDYATPLGVIPIDPLASKLLEEHTIFNNRPEIHARKHALEVILPFLQFWLKKAFRIIPIIIGGESEETPRELARILKPYFMPPNLFIISSDFFHYPSYSDAVLSDTAIADALLTGLPVRFLQAKRELEQQNIPQLMTTACGWTAILTLLCMINGNPQYALSKIMYLNSGDSPFGGKDRVVGYHAIAVQYKNNKLEQTGEEFESIQIDPNDRINFLLKIARNTLEEFVNTREKYKIPPSLITTNLQQKAGAFVTLRKNGKLRGYIGTFHPRSPLYETIRDLTISSAAYDYRFNPVTPDELSEIEIEISILTPLRKIQNIDEIELGRDGIHIKKGAQSGTFLPQVATQTKLDERGISWPLCKG